MNKLINTIRLAMQVNDYARDDSSRKSSLTETEKSVLAMNAEGNVYLALGLVRTADEMEDMKREVLADVA